MSAALPPRAPRVVAIGGEVDHHSAPGLRSSIFAAMRENSSDIVVDLSEATFIDSTALGVLLDARRRLIPSGRLLSVVCADRNILRLFELTALDRLFGIFPSLAEALAAVNGGPAKQAVVSGDRS